MWTEISFKPDFTTRRAEAEYQNLPIGITLAGVHFDSPGDQTYAELRGKAKSAVKTVLEAFANGEDCEPVLTQPNGQKSQLMVRINGAAIHVVNFNCDIPDTALQSTIAALLIQAARPVVASLVATFPA